MKKKHRPFKSCLNCKGEIIECMPVCGMRAWICKCGTWR